MAAMRGDFARTRAALSLDSLNAASQRISSLNGRVRPARFRCRLLKYSLIDGQRGFDRQDDDEGAPPGPEDGVGGGGVGGAHQSRGGGLSRVVDLSAHSDELADRTARTVALHNSLKPDPLQIGGSYCLELDDRHHRWVCAQCARAGTRWLRLHSANAALVPRCRYGRYLAPYWQRWREDCRREDCPQTPASKNGFFLWLDANPGLSVPGVSRQELEASKVKYLEPSAAKKFQARGKCRKRWAAQHGRGRTGPEAGLGGVAGDRGAGAARVSGWHDLRGGLRAPGRGQRRRALPRRARPADRRWALHVRHHHGWCDPRRYEPAPLVHA